MDLKKILSNFGLSTDISPYGNGHINDTYCVSPTRYILQRINTSIFTNPDGLMGNIENVTSFLREKIIKEGGNPDRETLTVIKTNDSKNYYQDETGCYRVYTFIENTVTIEDEKTEEVLFQAGRGFGKFQKMLADFPAEKLFETIKDFHNTKKRVEALELAIKEDKAGRAASVKEEIEFALENAKYAGIIVDGIEDGSIPLRVTHNDTKINNILFDDKTLEPACVIDLDTVMPGSLLYDFGDALRMGASSAKEDEVNLDITWFKTEIFEVFLKGFLSETKESITEKEVSLLHFAPWIMTYECGIRFLTDYLNGDVYFKIHREHHNLDRTRNHFKLCKDIKAKENELKEIVKKYL